MNASPPPETASVRRAGVAVLSLVLLGGMIPLGVSTSVTMSHDASQWQASFPLGLWYIEWDQSCIEFDSCAEYEGISLVDLDVAAEVEDLAGDDPGDDELSYHLYDNDVLRAMDTWRICWYNDAEKRLGCDTFTGGRGFGEMSWDTSWVRIILLTNLERDATLDLGRV